MVKLMHYEFHDNCKGCPYLRYDEYDFVYKDDGWDCNNPDIKPIRDDTRILNTSDFYQDKFPPFPDWCPLPIWKEQDEMYKM